LITCLRDTRVVGIQNQNLNFEVIKFGIVWIIKLSLQFFIIYWN
jgi:hypothetical protein